MWTAFKRIVRSGFVGFWRNPFVSATSVLVMTVALFVIASTLFGNYSLNSALEELQDKVDINVYMVTTASEEDILKLKTSLEALPDVREVTYTSREAALAEFRERHQDDELTIQALEELGENPLGASLAIRAQETSQYESIANFLEEQRAQEGPDNQLIDRVNYFNNKAAIERLSEIIENERSVNGIQVALLILLAAFVSFNTIRLVIYSSRDEISVMRLVGASNFFISTPFIVSGILQGLIAGIIVLLTLYPVLIYHETIFYPFPFFDDGTTQSILFNYFVSDFGSVFLVIVGSGMLIGAASSFLAVRRYLRI